MTTKCTPPPPHTMFRVFGHQTITMNIVGCFNILIIHVGMYSQITATVQSPWQANTHSASEDIPRILRNSKVRHSAYKTPPFAPVTGHVNPVHAPILFSVNFNIITPSLPRSSKCSLSFMCHQQTLYAPSLCPIHAKCSAHFPLLDKYPVRSRDHEASHYADSSSPLLPHSP